MGDLEWPTRSQDLAIYDFSLGILQNKIWDVPQPQQPVTIQQPSAMIVRESRNMTAILI